MLENQLSIIIPVYNERERIVKLVDFLVKNASENLLEILIVNASKSSDKLEDEVFPDKVKLIASNLTSRAFQMQKGADESCGNILYFLHADTFPPTDYLPRIIEALSRYDFGMFNYQFDRRQWNFRFNGWMTQWKAFYTGGGDQGLFLFKNTFQKVKGFDLCLRIMEDYDLFWRLKKLKMKYVIVKSPALVSSRKYEKNNGFKVNVVNLITLLGFKWTGNAKRWGDFYSRHIK